MARCRPFAGSRDEAATAGAGEATFDRHSGVATLRYAAALAISLVHAHALGRHSQSEVASRIGKMRNY